MADSSNQNRLRINSTAGPKKKSRWLQLWLSPCLWLLALLAPGRPLAPLRASGKYSTASARLRWAQRRCTGRAAQKYFHETCLEEVFATRRSATPTSGDLCLSINGCNGAEVTPECHLVPYLGRPLCHSGWLEQGWRVHLPASPRSVQKNPCLS